MKNLEVFGVEEMNTFEMQELNGGGDNLVRYFAAGVAGGAALVLIVSVGIAVGIVAAGVVAVAGVVGVGVGAISRSSSD